MLSINNMPLDIWREILVRLPAGSLFRARAVSKRCRAVIDDPSFVREHTNNSSSKIIFQNRKFCADEGSCYSLDLEALINFSKNGQPLELNVMSDSPEGLSLPVAACNGLVLTEKPLVIWNPLTHQRLELPRGGFKKYVQAFGLGYDSANDDYKVVVILRTRETHVYSLKQDSWRSIMNCPPFDVDSQGPVGPGIFVCGALNWLSRRKNGAYNYDDYYYGDDQIVALDLTNEKYSLLQMPHQTGGKKKYKSGMLLNVIGGCLALCDIGLGSYLDVWVMKVYGDEGSWTKFFSIENEQNISVWRGYLRPVAFIMKERLVFLEDGRGSFFMFDVETKSLKLVNIDVLGSYSYAQAQQMFVETIFSLHANCGGDRKKATKKRKIMSCTTKKKKNKKNKKSSAEELVFCLREANGEFLERL